MTPTERAIIAADAVAHLCLSENNIFFDFAAKKIIRGGNGERARFLIEQYQTDATGDAEAFVRHLFASLAEIQQEHAKP